MMRSRSILLCILFASLTVSASAQRRIFEPDDFVDPALHGQPVYVLRAVAGGVVNPTDHFRKHAENAGFALVTGTLYTGRVQFDYKHNEFAGGDDPPVAQPQQPQPPQCGNDCDNVVVVFPAAATSTGTQRMGRGDTLQVAFYRTTRSDVTLRYRLAISNQQLETFLVNPETGLVEQRSGQDRSLTFDGDTHVRIAGRNFWGSLSYARTQRSDTHDDHTQNEFLYTALPPGWARGAFLFRSKVKVGAITGGGSSSLSVINPTFEAVWRRGKGNVNLHAVWSLEGTRADATGWRTTSQVAVFAEGLYVMLLKR